MTVLVASPNVYDDVALAQAHVCGLPLLVRVIAGAVKAGASHVILVERSAEQHHSLMRQAAAHPLLANCDITVIPVPGFDPENIADWSMISDVLPPRFVWLPWNRILTKAALKALLEPGQPSAGLGRLIIAPDKNRWDSPIVIERTEFINNATPEYAGSNYGENSTLITSPAHIAEAERQLIRNSGKETDGVFSRMNRRLCWPLLRLLCKTPVTPNEVTVAGVVLAVVSGYFFAQGHWSAYVLGALAYFACVLCDEIDGMLARIKFSDSALGCWLETVADYASYVFMFVGLTIGLYHQSGETWLRIGLLMVVGSALTMLVLSYQRKMITDPDRPQEFRKKLQTTLERDSANPISWLGRNLEFMIRKPAYCYWVLAFCLLGLTKLLVFLTAFGANVAWVMALSYHRLFKPMQVNRPVLRGEQL